ncbi:MAG: DUF5615 family PIN-like protein [Fimbriimonadaceae bacterium]|nr:MAG: DUF5615 family PIN-like protein [Fimbriimonadaceae bacterium]
MIRILLDENIDPQFAESLTNFNVQTVNSMGWRGLKNGELLAQTRKDFDVLITLDRGILYQHNHEASSLSIFVLRTPDGRLKSLLKLLPKLLVQLGKFVPGQLVEIEEAPS